MSQLESDSRRAVKWKKKRPLVGEEWDEDGEWPSEKRRDTASMREPRTPPCCRDCTKRVFPLMEWPNSFSLILLSGTSRGHSCSIYSSRVCSCISSFKARKD